MDVAADGQAGIQNRVRIHKHGGIEKMLAEMRTRTDTASAEMSVWRISGAAFVIRGREPDQSDEARCSRRRRGQAISELPYPSTTASHPASQGQAMSDPAEPIWTVRNTAGWGR